MLYILIISQVASCSNKGSSFRAFTKCDFNAFCLEGLCSGALEIEKLQIEAA